jgi:hypothetical protein
METEFRGDFPNQFGKEFPLSFPERETIAQLIAQYGPQRAGRYATLRPHADFIMELRRNGASYDTVVVILRERHALQISDTTVRLFCRDILQERPARRRAKATASPAATRPAAQILSTRPARNASAHGPQIADVEFIKEQ